MAKGTAAQAKSIWPVVQKNWLTTYGNPFLMTQLPDIIFMFCETRTLCIIKRCNRWFRLHNVVSTAHCIYLHRRTRMSAMTPGSAASGNIFLHSTRQEWDTQRKSRLQKEDSTHFDCTMLLYCRLYLAELLLPTMTNKMPQSLQSSWLLLWYYWFFSRLTQCNAVFTTAT